MPPLPKRKLSKGRRDRRRSHLALKAQNLTECPNCHHMLHARVDEPRSVYELKKIIARQKEMTEGSTR